MQRYQWEDALIKAESAGTINSTAVNVALRLSSAINWAPKTKKPAGLYLANEEAAAAVNVSRASLYRALKVLKAAGFLVESKGNLLPVLPESQIETSKSQIYLDFFLLISPGTVGYLGTLGLEGGGSPCIIMASNTMAAAF